MNKNKFFYLNFEIFKKYFDLNNKDVKSKKKL